MDGHEFESSFKEVMEESKNGQLAEDVNASSYDDKKDHIIHMDLYPIPVLLIDSLQMYLNGGRARVGRDLALDLDVLPLLDLPLGRQRDDGRVQHVQVQLGLVHLPQAVVGGAHVASGVLLGRTNNFSNQI